MARFGSIEDGGGEGANTWYRVTIAEGRNRYSALIEESIPEVAARKVT